MAVECPDLKKITLEINKAETVSVLEEVKVKYLGRRGLLNQFFKKLVDLSEQERKQAGIKLNQLKKEVENLIKEKKKELESQEIGSLKKEVLDVTIPGIKPALGSLHLITQTIKEITDILKRIGFERASYPEAEWDWYPFEGLNMPQNHPARDEWETFFVKDLESKKYGKGVLTPHTSSGQLREMERRKPPIRMLNIAKCYRRQEDASHAPMFYQFEGLLIDKNVNISHLKGTLDYFTKSYFGAGRETRIRPFHFQFTEPSFEVDVSCILCGGKGCQVCKEGWLELGGAGMVHPTVLKNGGIDPKRYSSFAWGWGVERLFMMKYGIPDIRMLFEGDLRFLKQF